MRESDWILFLAIHTLIWTTSIYICWSKEVLSGEYISVVGETSEKSHIYKIVNINNKNLLDNAIKGGINEKAGHEETPAQEGSLSDKKRQHNVSSNKSFGSHPHEETFGIDNNKESKKTELSEEEDFSEECIDNYACTHNVDCGICGKPLGDSDHSHCASGCACKQDCPCMEHDPCHNSPHSHGHFHSFSPCSICPFCSMGFCPIHGCPLEGSQSASASSGTNNGSAKNSPCSGNGCSIKKSPIFPGLSEDRNCPLCMGYFFSYGFLPLFHGSDRLEVNRNQTDFERNSNNEENQISNVETDLKRLLLKLPDSKSVLSQKSYKKTKAKKKTNRLLRRMLKHLNPNDQ